MSAEENKATLLRLLNELKKGNLDFIDEVFSPNFAFYCLPLRLASRTRRCTKNDHADAFGPS